MHQPIRDHLEDYLRDPGSGKIPREFQAHLAGCDSCSAELQVLDGQTRLLRALRGSEDVEPSPGFYARVMDRIEDKGTDSVWSVFLDRAFGRRLAFASAAFVLLLGTYLVSTEPADHPADPSWVVTQQSPVSAIDDGTVQPGERDAVLVNLASYRE